LPDSAKFREFMLGKIRGGVPGMTMLIENPEGQWRGAAGFADLQNQTPMQPCHLLRVGSITKTFTAILILLLQEEGVLTIEDSIKQHLSSSIVERIRNADQATIKQLLNHTSGIADYSDEIDFSLAQLDRPTRKWTAAQELEFVYDAEPQFAVGTKRNYCNTNFLLLGLIAEHATGRTGSALFQEKIFDPLGLSSTYFSDEGALPDQLVRGYWDDLGNLKLRDATGVTFAHHSMAGGSAALYRISTRS
nr:beta-lactamase family protein [Saprospiraceae bacterium]